MKPILFNNEMVRAILAGQKKVTRRVMKDVPCFLAQDIGGKLYVEDDFGNEYPAEDRCQYKVGDILYVRETWQYTDQSINVEPGYVYRATDPDWETMEGWKWRPSIHMPKEAARIFLKVKAVRVEQLQDITEEGAQAEGLYKGWRCSAFPNSTPAFTARQAFMWLWDMTVNPKSGYESHWLFNPWVYVIEFERISKEEAYGK